jgi:hypothetical protein
MNRVTRRRALRALSGAVASLAAASAPAAGTVTEVFVSPTGNDASPGTRTRPLKSFAAAQKAARKLKSKSPVMVWFRAGVHYLPETVVFRAEDSGSKANPVTYAALPGEEAVISGGIKLAVNWEPYRDGIMKAHVPTGLKTDQLFLNGRRQVLARFPNFDATSQYFEGWSPDAFSKERAARWADPKGGYIHAMQRAMVGRLSLHHHRQERRGRGDVRRGLAE